MTARIRGLAAIASLALMLAATLSYAGKDDYTFEPVSTEVRNGAGSELAVRLVHKPTGKPVEGAVLFRTRLDMSPDSMGEMTANFKIMAKVPGEADTVQGTVVFQAKD